jgi:hypothetical protein
MKKIILALCFFIPALVHAQTDNTTRKFQYQAGFDATNFIKQFISMNDIFTGTQNPYAFSAKALKYCSDRTVLNGIRLGFGYQSSSQVNNPDSSMESSFSFNTTSARLGYERQYLISKNWLFYLGADLMYASSANKTEQHFQQVPGGDIFKITSAGKSASFGAGPVLGMQFDINKRLCLSTEASFTVQKSTARFKTESTAPNAVNNPESKSIFHSTSFILPSFINFCVKL